MATLTTAFIISQILVFIAMFFDFSSLQFKKRKQVFFCLIISSLLNSLHYFFLGKTAAGIIVFFSVLRCVTCYYTTNKRFLIFFLILNTLSLFVTYKELYDFIVLLGISIFIIGSFIADNKRMRLTMMLGTTIILIYNVIIFSPMGAIMEASFLLSNIIGYYRHFVRKKKTISR